MYHAFLTHHTVPQHSTTQGNVAQRSTAQNIMVPVHSTTQPASLPRQVTTITEGRLVVVSTVGDWYITSLLIVRLPS